MWLSITGFHYAKPHWQLATCQGKKLYSACIINAHVERNNQNVKNSESRLGANTNRLKAISRLTGVSSERALSMGKEHTLMGVNEGEWMENNKRMCTKYITIKG